MKAIRIHGFGGPEVLKYEDVPEPELRKDQVLVQVKACALNHLDLFVRKGIPGIKPPLILGSDVSGVVAKVEEYITDLKEGQRVLLAPMRACYHCEFCLRGEHSFCAQFAVRGTRFDGGDCEYVAVPRVEVIPIPESLTYDEAASVPLVFLTAWHMLVSRAKIKHGQTVLVWGAGSGVGTAAIQICKLMGCTVITTAGGERKLDLAWELGADYTIDHYKQKVSDEVKKIVKGGVDVVFEHTGEKTWPESLRSMRVGGTLVTCGATTGPEAKLDLRVLFTRQLTFMGSFMGTFDDLNEALKYVFSGALKPVVDRSFALREAAAAHSYLEKGEQFGKVVLNP
ncbi:Alcohol dehydrogenase, zinc-binding protein [Candidatus Koribacter versatilis Ellin345]|uniref:Alcohol dehydrogenase, zinc-binding protein n=1 Tax=Koribacter versatilis (strain Ellin345) TaxID=204669 RepID=Q1INA4_KORVE|nr:zinc-binding dehydrogenase [Candidatus Koribacter versatilis]ABF41646.1 Alcohol dehydrogenase, zinc-binding protein [Candidatus Koribacter versatilis Ellin345]